MSSRAKSNRGRFFGRRRAKPVQLERAKEILVIDPARSFDDPWRFFEIFADSRNQAHALSRHCTFIGMRDNKKPTEVSAKPDLTRLETNFLPMNTGIGIGYSVRGLPSEGQGKACI
jgi:hypothetical protein